MTTRSFFFHCFWRHKDIECGNLVRHSIAISNYLFVAMTLKNFRLLIRGDIMITHAERFVCQLFHYFVGTSVRTSCCLPLQGDVLLYCLETEFQMDSLAMIRENCLSTRTNDLVVWSIGRSEMT